MPGTVCHETICLNDFTATVAEIIRFELSGNCAEDSTSLLPLISGQRERLPDRPLVIKHDYSGHFAIRKGEWKLVEKSQLFDLGKDPKESQNETFRAPVLKLSKSCRRHWIVTGVTAE